MENKELLITIAKELGLTVRENNSAVNRQLLATKINELLNTDFQKLVSILYRMDVSEAKLKLLLKDNPGSDAGIIIADLMIERQIQKIKSRQQFRQRDNDIDENEKW
jgi:hypothetical protein